MKSIFPLCIVAGAVSSAPTCQGDETTLLQGQSLLRAPLASAPASAQTRNNDPYGFDDTIEAATASLARVLQLVENAQRQIDDAFKAYDGCANEEQASSEQQLESHAAEVERCHATLAQLRTAETQQCDTAEDCLCDEARLATTDHEELCLAKTETYEGAFCSHHELCTTSRRCLATEAGVYQSVKADVEAEMEQLVLQYTNAEVIRCTNSLYKEAAGPPASALDRQAFNACFDVDVSAITITYPEEPTQPAACPAHTSGNPSCVAGQVFFKNLIGHDHFIGSFENDVAVTVGDYFLQRIDCTSRLIQARVQGQVCGGEVTLQFRITDETAAYFRDGIVPARRGNGIYPNYIEDVTVVSGKVQTLPEKFETNEHGWAIGSLVGRRLQWFASSSTYTGRDQCNSAYVSRTAEAVATLTCMNA